MLERLAWISAFDVLPLVSLETKRRLMEWAVEKRALLVSVHAPYPGLGRLRVERRREAEVGRGKRKRSGLVIRSAPCLLSR